MSEQTPLLQNQHTDSDPEVGDCVNDGPVGEKQHRRLTKGEIIRYSLFGLFALVVTATIVDAIIRTPDVKVFPSVPREYSDH